MSPATPPAAVVFDMDGVLIDSERAWRLAENDYLARIAPGYTPAHHHLVIGVRLQDLHRLMCERFGAIVSWEDFRRHYEATGDDIYRRRTRLMPRALEMLHALKAENIPLGLASSSPQTWIQATLSRFELGHLFACAVSGEQVACGKPAPDIYRAAVDALGQAPERCWAVEDTDVGLRAAGAAGLYAVGFRNGDNERQSFKAAHRVIDDLGALLGASAPKQD